MLDAAGFRVDRQVLADDAYNRKVNRMFLDRPAEQQTWDIALAAWGTPVQFPIFGVYEHYAISGMTVWGLEGTIRPRYEELIRTVDPERQKSLLRQLERWTSEEAYFLFLYSPVELWAVGRSVTYVPPIDQGALNLPRIAVADGHWSLRPGAGRP
jgi:ABC-type transport system substrate-binding protein